MDPSPDHLRVRWFAIREEIERSAPSKARLVNELFARLDSGASKATDLGSLIALLSALEGMLGGARPPAPQPPKAAAPAGERRLAPDQLSRLRGDWNRVRVDARAELPDLAQDVGEALTRLAAGRGEPTDLALVELGIAWARHVGTRPETWEQPG